MFLLDELTLYPPATDRPTAATVATGSRPPWSIRTSAEQQGLGPRRGGRQPIFGVAGLRVRQPRSGHDSLEFACTQFIRAHLTAGVSGDIVTRRPENRVVN